MSVLTPANVNARYFAPRRLAHVNYWVKDVEGVGRFYRDIVGCTEAYRRPMIAGIFLSNGNTYHDFAFMDVDGPIGKGHAVGLHHFAFELATEIEMIEGYERALADRWKFSHTMSADVAHSVYGDDPDGNAYEVYADVYEDFRERRSGVVGVKLGWKPRDTEPVREPRYPARPHIIPVDNSLFRMKRTAHVTLVARDYEAMVAHYTRLVGLTPVHGGIESAYTVLAGILGEWSLSIFRPTADLKPGLHHTGIEAFEEADLDRGLAKAKDYDVTIVEHVDHPIRRSVFIQDPCGQLLQIFVDRARTREALQGISAEEALKIL